MASDRTVEFMYDGRRCTLRYRDSDHSYRIKIDEEPWLRYVAMSTYSKVSYSDPSGLMAYSARETAEGRDYKETTRFTQLCGNAAHSQLEALAKTGEPLDLSGQPERVRGALQAVAKWYLDLSPDFKASEVIVCAPSLRAAGRFDFLAEIDGELFIGDLKTSDKNWDHFRRYKAAAAYAQLAGYATAYAEMFPDNPQPTGRAILHVNTSGDFDWKPDLAPDESEESFLSKVDTYRADQAWSKRYEAKRKVAA